uniref:Alpha-conotoxin In1907 n=1 Tax=Conus inscriptus TaxID=257329 RepID=CA907_CONIN|nr:RecName: Full=Alpha-conotoxin In1907; AltName: Full=Alpha-conotoxin In1857; AltName: Full=Alpha-conotoxin In1874; AltName: Full=Alpha-conotoxin In1891 [Conus inscriptus]
EGCCSNPPCRHNHPEVC